MTQPFAEYSYLSMTLSYFKTVKLRHKSCNNPLLQEEGWGELVERKTREEKKTGSPLIY